MVPVIKEVPVVEAAKACHIMKQKRAGTGDRDDLSYKRMLTQREGEVGIPGRGKDASKKASNVLKKVGRTLSWGRDGRKRVQLLIRSTNVKCWE